MKSRRAPRGSRPTLAKRGKDGARSQRNTRPWYDPAAASEILRIDCSSKVGSEKHSYPPLLLPAGYEANDNTPDVRHCCQFDRGAPFCEDACPKGPSLLCLCHEAEAAGACFYSLIEELCIGYRTFGELLPQRWTVELLGQSWTLRERASS